jgi:hypothetical protein
MSPDEANQIYIGYVSKATLLNLYVDPKNHWVFRRKNDQHDYVS